MALEPRCTLGRRAPPRPDPFSLSTQQRPTLCAVTREQLPRTWTSVRVLALAMLCPGIRRIAWAMVFASPTPAGAGSSPDLNKTQGPGQAYYHRQNGTCDTSQISEPWRGVLETATPLTPSSVLVRSCAAASNPSSAPALHASANVSTRKNMRSGAATGEP